MRSVCRRALYTVYPWSRLSLSIFFFFFRFSVLPCQEVDVLVFLYLVCFFCCCWDFPSAISFQSNDIRHKHDGIETQHDATRCDTLGYRQALAREEAERLAKATKLREDKEEAMLAQQQQRQLQIAQRVRRSECSLPSSLPCPASGQPRAASFAYCARLKLQKKCSTFYANLGAHRHPRVSAVCLSRAP